MKYADGELTAHLQPGFGVIDIGANAGMLTAAYAKLVRVSGHVLAVEPDPETYPKLVAGVQQWPQVQTVQAAVGATEGETTIHQDGAQTSRWAALTPHQREPVTVPMTTVDALAPRVKHLRAIKIDVQGGEAEVLKGATETLTRPEIVWQLEVWPRGLAVAGSSVEALCACLEAAGLMPFSRSWQAVQEQAAGLVKSGSYLDVVCRHV
jgi:FkbM family methyltransferase